MATRYVALAALGLIVLTASHAVAQVSTGAAPLQRRPAAQLFYDGFEHFKAGRYSDAEQLFRAGLEQDDKDHRAWEWLARSQGALSKDDDAERSLQEAVKRGLPKEREEQARAEIFFPFPTNFPHSEVTCLSDQVQQVLRKVRAPRAKHRFEIYVQSRTKPQPEKADSKLYTGYWGYVPLGGGLFAYEGSFSEGSSPSDTKYKHLAYLGGLVECLIVGNSVMVHSLKITGTIFPLRVGNQFVIETKETYNMRRSCTVTDSRPASPEIIPTHPSEGMITTVSCDFSVGSLKPRKATYYFSSFLGAFVPWGGAAASLERYQIRIHNKRP